MALSSHERRILGDIEYWLSMDDPALNALLSSMQKVDARSFGTGGQLAEVWKASLARIPRVALVLAAVVFVGIVMVMAAGSSTPASTPRQQNACGTAELQHPSAGELAGASGIESGPERWSDSYPDTRPDASGTLDVADGC